MILVLYPIKSITSLFKSKFKAESFRDGSGNNTKRGLKFSKEVLDRLAIYYDVPNEIQILGINNDNNYNDIHQNNDPDGPSQSEGSNSEVGRDNNNSNAGATHATDATHSDDRQWLNEKISESPPPKNNEKNTTNTDNTSKLHNNAYYASVTDTRNNVKASPTSPPKCVASVASVTESSNKNKRNKAEEVGLPEIPCRWCNYKDCIEFDLVNHYLQFHKLQLFKLPIGKGSMEYRAEYVIEGTKRKMAASIPDDG